MKLKDEFVKLPKDILYETYLKIVYNPKDIPKIISTTLLMFRGKIIFNSFFGTIEVSFGNDMKKTVINDMKHAIEYYHL